MSPKATDSVHVVIPKTAAAKLDRLIAAAVLSGDSPMGRKPSRGSVIEALIEAATAQQTPCAGESEGR